MRLSTLLEMLRSLGFEDFGEGLWVGHDNKIVWLNEHLRDDYAVVGVRGLRNWVGTSYRGATLWARGECPLEQVPARERPPASPRSFLPDEHREQPPASSLVHGDDVSGDE